MHIKHIHEMIEKLSECAKMEMEKGIENVDTKEMGEVVDIIKDLAEAEYYAKISKAMDEAEYGEDYDEGGAYEDRRGYRGQPRDSMGRYRSRRGGRRGYEQPLYHMTPEMYRENSPEYYRDMDRLDGRMYYTEGSSSAGASSGGMSGRSGASYGGSTGGMSGGSGSSGGMSGSTRGYSDEYDWERDTREGRSGRSRRSYMESKEMHKGNSPEDKQQKMKDLENYMKELGTDITEMISDASNEEKTMLKSKLQTMIQKIQ